MLNDCLIVSHKMVHYKLILPIHQNYILYDNWCKVKCLVRCVCCECQYESVSKSSSTEICSEPVCQIVATPGCLPSCPDHSAATFQCCLACHFYLNTVEFQNLHGRRRGKNVKKMLREDFKKKKRLKRVTSYKKVGWVWPQNHISRRNE